MTDLFCSFVGTKDRNIAHGWTVVRSMSGPITYDVILRLTKEFEIARGYEAGSTVILSFQRLEKVEP